MIETAQEQPRGQTGSNSEQIDKDLDRETDRYLEREMMIEPIDWQKNIPKDRETVRMKGALNAFPGERQRACGQGQGPAPTDQIDSETVDGQNSAEGVGIDGVRR